jgi:MFS family permease
LDEWWSLKVLSGIITVCMGFTKSFGGLIACRFLLGVFEAGFMPGMYHSMTFFQIRLTLEGCIYLIAMYYKRYELQWRLNVFFSASILAGAVSGVCILLTVYLVGGTNVTGVVARICHCPDGWDSRVQWLALDLHHRGSRYCGDGSHLQILDCGLAGELYLS